MTCLFGRLCVFWSLGPTAQEDDGCLVEPRGTLNRDGVDLDFADGDQADYEILQVKHVVEDCLSSNNIQ